ncbi:MAG TPA: hypothetical protein DCL38_03505 [Lachnospiraceae bacterium]|nr:hypothetical protein [Lachnospiraceae bacterium]
MLENFDAVYDDRSVMLKRLKKKRYEENMNRFREVHGHFFREMMTVMEEAEDKAAASREISGIILDEGIKKVKRFGRVPGYEEVNLTFFMIYYIFPAILLEESRYNTMVADALQAGFNERFKNSNIRYADYQTIHDGFNEKILGIF